MIPFLGGFSPTDTAFLPIPSLFDFSQIVGLTFKGSQLHRQTYTVFPSQSYHRVSSSLFITYPLGEKKKTGGRNIFCETLDRHHTLWIFFQGTLSNEDTLCKELGFCRHHPLSDMFFTAYGKWGIRLLLEKMAGRFVFLLLDAPHGILYVGSDRISPCSTYYKTDESSFIFSSSLTLLLRWNEYRHHKKLTVSNQAILDFLLRQQPPLDQKTYLKEVFKIPPSSYLRVHKKNMALEKYSPCDESRGGEKNPLTNLSREKNCFL